MPLKTQHFFVVLIFLLTLSCRNKQQEDVFTFGFSEPLQSINPFKISGHGSIESTKFVIESLFRKKQGKLIPVLGTSYKISKKNKTLLVELRKGVKFHNDEKLTSRNIKFTYDCIMNSAYEAELKKPLIKNIKSIEIKSEYKALIHFSDFKYNDVYNFLQHFRVLPINFYSLRNKKKWNKKIIGTGPYVFSEFIPGSSLILKKNPHWWGENKKSGSEVKIKKLALKYVKDPSLAFQMIQSNRINIYPIYSIFEFFNEKRKKDSFFVANKQRGSHQIRLDFNLKQKFISLAVRKALSHSIDFDLINQKLFGGELELSVDAFDPQASYFPKGDLLKYQPQKAQELLLQDGWEDLNKDGLLEKEFPEGTRPLKLRLVVAGYTENRVASLIKEQLQKLGIEIDVVPRSSNLYQILIDGQYDLYLSTSPFDDDVAVVYFQSQNAFNYTGYKNKIFDEYIKQLDSTFDFEKRQKLMEKIILERRKGYNALYGPYYRGSFYLVSKQTELNKLDPRNPLFWDHKTTDY